MRIFISADMEGICGVVNLQHVDPGTKDYERFRKMMTREVNAFVEAAFEFGATEVVVNDSHANMDNILIEELHPKATLISGSPKPLSMMQGIDETFDAVFFVGYHARTGTVDAIMDHTFAGRVFCVKVNGKPLSEAGLNARVAGFFSVPVVLVSGDDKTIACAKEEINEFVPVVVKEAVGRYAAKVYPFEVVKERIKNGVKQALMNLKNLKPTVEKEPVHLEITFINSSLAELPCLIPGVERKDAKTIVYTASNYLEAYKVFRACLAINAGLK
ncbi:M55 family metallopeptidase [Pseudothermotoga thermarum]|uniref:D-aminopeptidase DppA n=1 Tax=Pseudothermotoga thermarum DSM 5069 TaxID=688269 RepID=F7YWT4_9THEM|nr:M55 family metallopeptidase [Pseudothermotoga thermarum]AEH50325.1 D-aminopeptidase DppA [Pseudothermotoga thermarum DSM 5069]